VTFPLGHQGVPPADSRYPPAGPGASAPQPAGRPPTVDATKRLHRLPPATAPLTAGRHPLPLPRLRRPLPGRAMVPWLLAA